MKVKTLKAHPYAGKRRKVDDVYNCLPKFAKVLKAIGKVEDYEPPKKQAVEKVETTTEAPAANGDKTTKQLKPSTDQEPAKPEVADTTSAAPARRGRGRPRKNTYKTTEMKAE